jgi:hypothetical protein
VARSGGIKQKPLRRISVATTLEAEDAVAELLGATSGQSAASCFNVETQTNIVSVYSARKAILAPQTRKKSGLD